MWLHLLTLAAVARLARLVTADRVFQPIRDWVGGVTRDTDDHITDVAHPMRHYFIECPWCTSIYLGVPVVIAVQLWPDSEAMIAVLLVLTASLVAGLLAQLEALMDAAAGFYRGPDPE